MKEKGKSIKVYFIGMIIVGITFGLTTVIADTIINSSDVSYKTTSVKAALDDLYGLTADDVWQKIYPVGSIYISAVSTSPATLFGGTWVEFGKGRTLVGVDTSDTSFNTVEKTGGEKTHTLTAAESGQKNLGSITSSANNRGHTHSMQNHTHTTNIGSHAHDVIWGSNSVSITPSGSGKSTLELTAWKWSTNGTNTNSGGMGTTSCNIGNKTSGGPSNNTTGAESQNHTHTVTISGSDATSAHNNLQPYITVYMWKRTA